MQRNFIKQLENWKKAPNRKPLILWGARQVGKTWIMQEFGKQFFKNTLCISFYNNKKYADVFNADYDTKRILITFLCNLQKKTANSFLGR